MAKRSTAAIRYAEAVYQVARDGQSFDLWLSQLGQAAGLLGDPLAASVMANPAVPLDVKANIIAEALPDLDPSVRRFVELLLRRGRLTLLPRVLDSLLGMVDKGRGLERVRITTAVPLGQAERELVASRLAARTGKRVQLEENVDPAVIGGVVAQIGDQILDGSVRGRLERLRRALAG